MGFSSSGSQSSQESYSGVPKELRGRAASTGLSFLDNILQPRILAFSQQVPQLQLSPYGLTTPTQNLFDRALQQSAIRNFSNTSANIAQLGGLRPDNLTGIVTEASRRAANDLVPTFAPISESNVRFNTTAPQSTQAATIGFLNALGQLYAAFTQGGEGKGASSASSTQFDTGLSGLLSGFGQGFGFGSTLPAA